MSETYTDLTDDGLDPADPWADVPEPDLAPVPRIVLRDMEPEERRSRLEELGHWLRWLVEVNPEARASVPPCWHRHEDVIEVVLALQIGWVRSYTCPSPGRDTAEADWLITANNLLPTTRRPKCANGHADPVSRPWGGPDEETLRQWLEEPGGLGTREREHPSPALAAELNSDEPPL
ncbi:hypothetical protein [Kitasatospora sp. NPDC056273]|uniref:hypothetical protein n=1 Tax=Kitasatospora sp. NPDC056273 TaxID=3345769 RepID=UPI0035DCF12F